MSNIFDLFAGVGEPRKQTSVLGYSRGTMCPMTKSKTMGSMLEPPLKSGLVTRKPKGLSLRSNSDLNRPSTPLPNVSKSSDSELDYCKPKLTQLDISGRPVSPRNKDKSSKVNEPLKMKSEKASSLKNISLKAKKSLDESCFKKPLTPKMANKKNDRLPEPEILAHPYDQEREFNYLFSESIDKEFNNLMKVLNFSKNKNEDEGFET
ncbi:uncharacterized protein LOC105694775 isoform X2 [Orussus abietinus]|uniref:uncharacterized protein LOC105694775 isoform X2 n=1 Tax=Orussus abietinus TaxID=222816 RepID=UPI000626A0F6|nr:uncharacterized protein LOC105694775 isoform X2 [Orussus abietinus]